LFHVGPLLLTLGVRDYLKFGSDNSGFQKRCPKFLIPDILGTRKFGFGYRVSGNLFYPILMLLTVKKEVNQGQREQIKELIMHVIISDSRRTPILNEQSS
jgi:hypothetical protein